MFGILTPCGLHAPLMSYRTSKIFRGLVRRVTRTLVLESEDHDFKITKQLTAFHASRQEGKSTKIDVRISVISQGFLQLCSIIKKQIHK